MRKGEDELGVENSALAYCRLLKNQSLSLSVHFYIILPATLSGRGPALVPLRNRPHLHAHRPSASVTASPNPLWASLLSRPATPVSTAVNLPHRHPHARHLAWSLRGGAAATATPRCTSARTPTVPIAAGSAGAISAPMAIPMGVPGASYCVWSVVATFSRPSARSFMANAPLSSSSCASSRAWPRV
jgi:hypothetical protein